MAVEFLPECITMTADGTIRQYRIVEISGDFTASECDGTADVSFGIAQEGATDGNPVVIAVGGISKLEAGESLTAGAWVGPATDGQAVGLSGGTADNVHAIGQMLDSPGAAAVVGTCKIDRGYFIADDS